MLPDERRKCRDVFCCLLFVLFCASLKRARQAWAHAWWGPAVAAAHTAMACHWAVRVCRCTAARLVAAGSDIRAALHTRSTTSRRLASSRRSCPLLLLTHPATQRLQALACSSWAPSASGTASRSAWVSGAAGNGGGAATDVEAGERASAHAPPAVFPPPPPLRSVRHGLPRPHVRRGRGRGQPQVHDVPARHGGLYRQRGQDQPAGLQVLRCAARARGESDDEGEAWQRQRCARLPALASNTIPAFPPPPPAPSPQASACAPARGCWRWCATRSTPR